MARVALFIAIEHYPAIEGRPAQRIGVDPHVRLLRELTREQGYSPIVEPGLSTRRGVLCAVRALGDAVRQGAEGLVIFTGCGGDSAGSMRLAVLDGNLGLAELRAALNCPHSVPLLIHFAGTDPPSQCALWGGDLSQAEQPLSVLSSHALQAAMSQARLALSP